MIANFQLLPTSSKLQTAKDVAMFPRQEYLYISVHRVVSKIISIWETRVSDTAPSSFILFPPLKPCPYDYGITRPFSGCTYLDFPEDLKNRDTWYWGHPFMPASRLKSWNKDVFPTPNFADDGDHVVETAPHLPRHPACLLFRSYLVRLWPHFVRYHWFGIIDLLHNNTRFHQAS
jgi:hypothetical protein